MIGVGDAAAHRASAVRSPSRPIDGLVWIHHGHVTSTNRADVAEASHPVLDTAQESVAACILQRMVGPDLDDLKICLSSSRGPTRSALARPSLASMRIVDEGPCAGRVTNAGMHHVRRPRSATRDAWRTHAIVPPGRVIPRSPNVAGHDPGARDSGSTAQDPTPLGHAPAVFAKDGSAIEEGMTALLADPACQPARPVHACLAHGCILMVISPQNPPLAAEGVTRKAGIPVLPDDRADRGAGEYARKIDVASTCAAHGSPSQTLRIMPSGRKLKPAFRGRRRGGREGESPLALAGETVGPEDDVCTVLPSDVWDGAGALGPGARGKIADDGGQGFVHAPGRPRRDRAIPHRPRRCPGVPRLTAMRPLVRDPRHRLWIPSIEPTPVRLGGDRITSAWRRGT